MIIIRKAEERGHANFGWLDSRHSFSFGSYYDKRYMGFSDLRVINDDRINAGSGFDTHPHSDMEIISYVLDGALAHRDSAGNGSVIEPGDVQLMSAGWGIAHSEFNHAEQAQTHFLQIWIMPNQRGTRPGYQQQRFSDADKRGRLQLIVSPDGADGSLTIQQDMRLYAALLDGDEAIDFPPAPGRKLWLQLARGSARVNGQMLQAGDGAALIDEATVRLDAGQDAELLLFDLAG